MSNIPTQVEIWACPECGSWAGSSSMVDLDTQPNHRSSLRNLSNENPEEWGRVTGMRNECQNCRAVGKTILRVRTVYVQLSSIHDALDRAVEAAYKAEEKSMGGVQLKRPA